MVPSESLPDPLPSEPLSIAAAWLAEAHRRHEQSSPEAMVLATSDASGRPSARVVLCKDIEPDPGRVRFVSNYRSRKGRELESNPRGALVMYWDNLHRQVRVEGAVRRSEAAESDRYFAQRPRDSQLGAHASAQSEPVASREALRAQLQAVEERYPEGEPVPRPAHWGMYELWADAVELWIEGKARLHDRARWTRELGFTEAGAPFAGPWTGTRLQP